LCGVDGGGWDDPHFRGAFRAVDVDVPAIVMNAVVAAGAEQGAVAEVGWSGVSLPPSHVVGFCHLGWEPAHDASAVSFDEREALRLREESLFATPVENLTVRSEDCGDDTATRG